MNGVVLRVTVLLHQLAHFHYRICKEINWDIGIDGKPAIPIKKLEMINSQRETV